MNARKPSADLFIIIEICKFTPPVVGGLHLGEKPICTRWAKAAVEYKKSRVRSEQILDEFIHTGNFHFSDKSE